MGAGSEREREGERDWPCICSYLLLIMQVYTISYHPDHLPTKRAGYRVDHAGHDFTVCLTSGDAGLDANEF